MANSNENTVSIQIPEEEIRKVLENLKQIDSILKPYLIALTPENRRDIPKMSDKTTPFVEKCLEYAESNPEFVPAYLNIKELKIDLDAVNSLLSIIRPITQLEENLNDTIMLSGSEAYVAALTYYSSIKQAARINVPNAKSIFEDLSKRFEKSKSKKE